MSIMGVVDGSSIFRLVSDSPILNSGVMSRAVGARTSKRWNSESHSCVEAPLSLNFVRGGNMSGGDGGEQLGGGPSTSQVLRWGSRTTWSIASCDNGIGEERCASDGPQRRMTEQNGSLKCVQVVTRRSVFNAVPTERVRRADVGIEEMVEAIAGRMSWGNPEWFHHRGALIQMFSKCGERSRST